ncbi:MAG: D-glycerate dehydrogenase [Armatimonadota bacterium]|nr:D-glycerate dehydrogenase [Armatimonadota bacterium]MDR5702130.1 D-glycerate dehydrogenase [Armatimonadota bacterium]
MSKPKVYVTRRLPGEAMDLLYQRTQVTVWGEDAVPPPKEVIKREVADAEGLISLVTDPIDAEVMDAAPKLRVISNYAVGYDNIDIPAATARGIVVTHTPGVLTETVADFTFALILAAARRVVEADRFTREGKWKSWEPMLFLGQDVYGATLGLVGLGRIGSAVARRAKGFNMRVLYYDVVRREDLERELGLEFTDLPTLLRESDFVSIHTPLTPETRHLIGAKELNLMKPTAILINTARGPIVDTIALAHALRERRIWAAGIDVFETEPVPPDHPLLQLDNVVVAPHIASASIATRTKMALLAVENLLSVLEGRVPPHPVNPEAIGKR